MFLTEEDMEMGRKRYTAEEVVAKLRQIDALTEQDHEVVDAIRTEVTYYRWRSEYGGLKGVGQAASGKRSWRPRTAGCAARSPI
jgi:hypothetical protein